jgi:hypothetical protein
MTMPTGSFSDSPSGERQPSSYNRRRAEEERVKAQKAPSAHQSAMHLAIAAIFEERDADAIRRTGALIIGS